MRRSLASVAAIIPAVAIALGSLARADDASQAARLYELLELEPHMTIADVGAGTGELTALMARRLPSGRVYATDIEPQRLKDIGAAAARAQLSNVTVLAGAETVTNLPEGCCDAIFIRDVYHHFSDPATMNQSVYASLKPGGRLAIIDFPPDPRRPTLPPSVPANRGGHGIRPELVESEVTAAGFTRLQRIDNWDNGRELFLLLFRKP